MVHAILGRARRLQMQQDMVSGDWNGLTSFTQLPLVWLALDIGFVPGKDGLDTNGMLKGAQSGD